MSKRSGSGMINVILTLLLVVAIFLLTTPEAIPTPLRAYTCVAP